MSSRQRKSIPVKLNPDDPADEKLDKKVLFKKIMEDIRLDLNTEDMITQITVEQLLQNYISSPNFKVCLLVIPFVMLSHSLGQHRIRNSQITQQSMADREEEGESVARGNDPRGARECTAG
jgi:hypothetical protein